MKLNWPVIVCGVIAVAAAFSLAVLEGANAAARDAGVANHHASRVVEVR